MVMADCYRFERLALLAGLSGLVCVASVAIARDKEECLKELGVLTNTELDRNNWDWTADLRDRIASRICDDEHALTDKRVVSHESAVKARPDVTRVIVKELIDGKERQSAKSAYMDEIPGAGAGVLVFRTPNWPVLRIEVRQTVKSVRINGEIRNPTASGYNLRPGTVNVRIKLASGHECVSEIEAREGDRYRITCP